MKTLTKVLVCLLVAASLVSTFIACSNDDKKDNTTTSSSSVKDPADTNTSSSSSSSTAPDNDNKPSTTGTALFNGAENDAQDSHKGEYVYWRDQADWEGAAVTVETAEISEDGVITIAFTHTGTPNGFGFQLFYNPADAANGDVYEVSFKIKASVNAKITVNGETQELTANEEKTITYTVTLDMHPEANDYQYGTSVIDIQFGVGHAAETTEDIVDGTYTISGVTATKTN